MSFHFPLSHHFCLDANQLRTVPSSHKRVPTHSLTFPPLTQLSQTNCNHIIYYRITTDPSSLSKKSSASTIPGSATVVNSINISDIGNGGGTAEVFAFNPEIASLIYQLWQDLVITKVMDHIGKFYLMDSAS
jgi:guanine nucleotide-binding protein G(i) subunit alpha